MSARRCLPLLLLTIGLLAGCPASRPSRETVTGEGGVVRVDFGTLAPGTGRFHSYRSPGGGHADFLVYRESGGEPRAVLDACTDCYRWRKGYRLDGDGVVCVKCGMRFRLDDLRDGIGGCQPIPLPATRVGDSLEIPVDALESATRYFS